MTNWDADANEIFADALEISTLAERDAFLDRRCAGNADLRHKVDALLAAHQVAGSRFLDQATMSPEVGADQFAETAHSIPERPGSKVGPYKLLEQIGEGGMGTVFLAEQIEPVRRQVALKIVKPGMDSGQVIARFEAERQALALMDHPNIARVLDAGTTAGGRPYFVMELVKGVPITEFCDRQRLTPRERIELFVPVCQAVQHAHQKGIIHRDLKPTNVLVAMYDDRPIPKVIDFGIAKATGEQLTDKTLFTSFGQVVGTLEYMSPEQAQLNQLDIDTRSDVYALGVMLYELLTGTTPLQRERIQTAAMLEVLRLIAEEETPAPSRRLSTSGALASIAAVRRSDPTRLPGLVRGELDWIVLKALEKDRKRRYESAGALRADLDRYLSDAPVEAHPPSAIYRLRKVARRHRAALVAAALLALLLIAGVAATTSQAVRATRAEQQARLRLREESAAKAAARKAQQAEMRQREAAVVARQDAVSQRTAAEQALERSQRLLYFNQIALADRYWQGDQLERADEILEYCEPQFRHWEWNYLKRLCHSEIRRFDGDHAVFSPQGNLLAIVQQASAGIDHVTLWDLRSERVTGTIAPGTGGIFKIAFSPDGSHLAAAVGDSPSRVPGMSENAIRSVPLSVRVFNVDERREIAKLQVTDAGAKEQAHLTWLTDLAFGSDHTQLVVATGVANPVQGGVMPGRLILWNTESGAKLWEKEQFGEDVAFHPQGTQLATAHGVRRSFPELGRGPGLSRTNLALLDPSSGEKTAQEFGLWLKSVSIYDIAYSPDGTWIGVLGSDGTMLVDVDEPLILRSNLLQRKIQARGGAIAFSGDSKTLAEGDSDGVIRIWDVPSREVRFTIRAHADQVTELSFHPEGKLLVSVSRDGTVRMWDVNAQQRWKTLDVSGRAFAVAISPDKSHYAVARLGMGLGPLRRSETIELRRASDGKLLKELASFRLTFGRISNALAFDQAGNRLAGEVGDHVLKVWDTATGSLLATLEGHTDRVGYLAFSSTGKYLASGMAKEIRIWDLEAGELLVHKERRADDPDRFSFSSVAFDPTGDRLAVADSGRVEFWDPATGDVLDSWRLSHSSHVSGIAISHDGRLLATSSWDGTGRIWDIATGKELHRLTGHRSYVNAIAFSADSRRLVTLGFHAAKLWDVETAHEILSWDVSDGIRAAFDSRNQHLAVMGRDKGIILDGSFDKTWTTQQ